MRIYVKYDFNKICKTVLKKQLDALGIQYTLDGIGEVAFQRNLTPLEHGKMVAALDPYGIEIMDDHHIILTQRIKDAITEWVMDGEQPKLYNFSTYISEKLDYAYPYLSAIFSETTYSSIENFIILKKIDHAKTLIVGTPLTLTEIAYKLNYSSVAHLSAQFKKTTGLTPSSFQKIIEKRKERNAMPG